VYVWLALGVATLVVLASAFYAVACALRAWRSFRRFRRRIFEAAGDVTRRAGEIERHLAEAGAAGARLEQAQARLQASLASARTLADAFGEFTALARFTGLLP
jgi:hypothetical protein